MNTRQKAAYDIGFYEYINYGLMASWEDFITYIANPEDYDFYVEGYRDAQSKEENK